MTISWWILSGEVKTWAMDHRLPGVQFPIDALTVSMSGARLTAMHSYAVLYRAVAITSQNHMTEYFRMAKERGVQWHLNGNY